MKNLEFPDFVAVSQAFSVLKHNRYCAVKNPDLSLTPELMLLLCKYNVYVTGNL